MEIQRTLVLVPQSGTPGQSSVLAAIAERKGSLGEILTVPLGFVRKTTLDSISARSRTPESYFDKNESSQINTEALRLAQGWYADWTDRVTYKGVNLAEMCEYGFYFVFVDCLRSLRIARSMIGEEKLDLILLPRTTMSREVSEVCYEALPNALELLAPGYGVKTERLEDLGPLPESNGNGRKPRLTDPAFAYEWTIEALGPLLRQPRVPFVQVYAYDRLAARSKNRGLRPVRCVPYRRETETSKRFTADLQKALADFKGKMLEISGTGQDPDRQSVAVGIRRFEEFFLRQGPILAGFVEWTENYLARVHPRLMVTMEDITPVKRCIARTSRMAGVKTIVLQHGLYDEDTARFYLMPVEGGIQAVWGEYYSKWLLAHGKAADSEAVVGAPSLEDLMPSESRIAAARSALNIERSARVLVVGTSRYAGVNSRYTVEKEERFFDGVYAGLKGLRDYRIVTKMHPSCGSGYFEMANACAEEQGISTVITKSHLRELMAMSEIVVIPISSIGYEAVLMSKPLVCTDFEGSDNESVFVDGGVATGAANGSQLRAAIEGAVKLVRSDGYADARRHFLESHLNIGHGEASDLVAGLIERETRHTEGRPVVH